jgi:hypothetical protein
MVTAASGAASLRIRDGGPDRRRNSCQNPSGGAVSNQ